MGNTVGIKHDQGKPRFDLIPPAAEKMLAEVLTFGASKYGPNNWKNLDNINDRYIAAALRHINAHRNGEIVDQESGYAHLAHAMCCLAFLCEYHEDTIQEWQLLDKALAEAKAMASDLSKTNKVTSYYFGTFASED